MTDLVKETHSMEQKVNGFLTDSFVANWTSIIFINDC